MAYIEEEGKCDSCGTALDRAGDHSYVVCRNCLNIAAPPEDWDEAIYKVRMAFETLEEFAKPRVLVMDALFESFKEAWTDFKKVADEFLIAYYG